MKFSIKFLLGLTLIIAFTLATVRLGWTVARREMECVLEKPFENHFATGKPLPTLYTIEKEIRKCEEVLSGLGIPLNSTRFREDISKVADPAIYFADKKVQQLCLAINANNLDEMKRLVLQGVNVNAQGDGGLTPLFWAFAQNKPDAFKLLLVSKADPDLRLTDLIHMRGSYANTDESIFTLSVRFDWVSRQFLRDAIPYSKNINQRSANGDTLLMTFARQLYDMNFDKISCEALVAAGVDLNAQNDRGESVCTLSHLQPEKCLWFIEHGADPTLKRHDGTELMDLLAPRFANNKPSLNQTWPAVMAERIREDQEFQTLRDKVLEFKRRATSEVPSEN